MMLTALVFWVYSYILTIVFVLQWSSLHHIILIKTIALVSLDFSSNSKRDAIFHLKSLIIFVLVQMTFVFSWKMFPGRISLMYLLLLLLVPKILNVSRWKWLCIPRIKSIIASFISWFLVAFCATIFHKGHLLCWYQQNKVLFLKSSSNRLIIVAKLFLSPPKILVLTN